MGLGSHLDESEKSRHHRVSIPGPSTPQRIAIPTELFQPWIFCTSFTVFIIVFVFFSPIYTLVSQVIYSIQVSRHVNCVTLGAFVPLLGYFLSTCQLLKFITARERLSECLQYLTIQPKREPAFSYTLVISLRFITEKDSCIENCLSDYLVA